MQTHNPAKYALFFANCLVLVLFLAAARGQDTLVIEGGTLFDGTGAAPRKIAAVMVRGNRIREIVPEGGAFQVPSGAQRIRGEGLTVLPGLIDSHVHYQGWDAELYISHGITSVFDMGSNAEWILAQKEGTANGRIYGPRVFNSGRGFGAGLYGSHLGMIMVRDVEDALRVTRDTIAASGDFIKVHDGITPQQLEAVVREAHRAGLSVAGHLGFTDAREAAAAGIDVIAHMSGVLTALAPPDLARKVKAGVLGDGTNYFEGAYNLKIDFPWDEKRAEELAKFLIEKKVKMEPDIVNRTKGLYPQWPKFESEIFQLLKDPGLGYIRRSIKDRWHYQTRMNDPLLHPEPKDYLPKSREETERMLALQKRNHDYLVSFVKKFVALGGEITVGSDAQHRVVPGLSYHQEMEMLIENAGMTPMQALVSATRNPARVFHKEKDLGTVETGKLADLILVRGDPLADIRNLRNIATVMKDGKVMETGYHAWFTNVLPRPPVARFNGEHYVPEITAVTPSIAKEGTAEIVVKIRGKEFAEGCVVTFDGRGIPLVSGSPTEITIKLGREDLVKVGTWPLVVINPIPGGGPSNPGYFMVKFRQ